MSATFSRIGSSTLLSLAALVAAACADSGTVMAPAELERIASPLARVLACTNNWKDPVNGLWTDATKWSTGVAPGAADDVCIMVDGDYTVTLNGTRTARNLTLGASSGTPLLLIEALQLSTTGAANPAILTVANDVENSGVIRMTSRGFVGRDATLIVGNGTVGALHNLDGGVIEVIQGNGGGRTITGDVVNDGTIDVQWNVGLSLVNGELTNNNAVTVATTRTLSTSVGYDFVQAAGTLTLDGTLSMSSGMFALDGGAISGTPLIMLNSHLNIGATCTGTGSFRLQGTSFLSGDVRADQTITIEGRRPTTTGPEIPAVITAQNGFNNAGTIQLTASGFTVASATLNVTTGAITNSGTIETLQGSGGGRTINGDLINDGTVDLAFGATFNLAGGLWTNNSVLTIPVSRALNISNGASFRQAGGTLTETGTYTQTGGTFHLDGGTITGVPTLSGVALQIGAGSTAAGTVETNATSTITGDVASGQTIVVEGIRPASTGSATSAVLTATGSFSNAGIIQMTSSGFTTSGTATLAMGSHTLTNAAGGRIETFAASGGGRVITGNLVNDGTLQLGVTTQYNSGTLRNVAPGTIAGGVQLTLQSASVFYGTGSITANINNAGQFHAGASPGLLAITGTYVQTSVGAFNAEIGGSVPGTDFDRVTVSGSATLAGTLNVSVVDAANGGCVDGGSSFEMMTFASRSGDFTTKTGLILGGGRTVQTVPSATNYRLDVLGPPCVAPDNTPPVIAASVTGTLGNNDWYVSNVTVTWQVTDAESSITSSTGCETTDITADTDGAVFTCTATSAGGTSSVSVTIKRDATAPSVSASRAPAANANGWNNSNVTATYSATDGMSGIAGSGTATQVFSVEGAGQSGSHTFLDLAGNSATASVSGISIDMTAPVVQASRAPAANGFGWNNTDVAATYSATDALSGISGAPTAGEVFSMEGANQGGSHTFTDLAGNSATASVSGIAIDKTAPTVVVTRSPAPNADGWNNTDVTVTYAASDGLSGIAGDATFVQVFSMNGANQSGSHTFSDRAGNSTIGTVSGINIDKTPVAVACSVTPSEIWPPNHRMVAVRVTIVGSDIVSFALRSATNNETGASDIEGFAIGTADLEGSVRATRTGSAGGRVYTLVYDVMNRAGSQSSCTLTVAVPHDQGKKK